MNDWRLLSYRKRSAFENMAIDEAVFRGNQQGLSPPTLRFYGWDPPAVSLGYFQDIEAEINVPYCRRNRIQIVRRPTGGKAVFHDDELTYSLVSRDDNRPFSSSILETYLVISRCIVDGLASLGVDATMAEQGRPLSAGNLPAHCFSLPSRYELLVKGRKICGSAQTRANGVFLQHGSLLLRFDPFKAAAVVSQEGVSRNPADSLKESVTSLQDHIARSIDPGGLSRVLSESFEKILQIRLTEGRLTPEEETLKERLLTDKYGRETWNREGGKLWWE